MIQLETMGWTSGRADGQKVGSMVIGWQLQLRLPNLYVCLTGRNGVSMHVGKKTKN